MANTNNNPYAGKSVADLKKSFDKLEKEYRDSMSKGKMTSIETANIRRERARLLTALNQAN